MLEKCPKRSGVADREFCQEFDYMSDQGHSLKGPRFVITAEGDVHGEDSPENRELVRRIHACVNACDGISIEELESGIVEDMRQVITQVVPLLKTHNEMKKQLTGPQTFVADQNPARNTVRS